MRGQLSLSPCRAATERIPVTPAHAALLSRLSSSVKALNPHQRGVRTRLDLSASFSIMLAATERA